MLPTSRDLHELAAASGFAVGSLEKVIRLAEMLSGIGELEDLARALALKGGTALNLFFGPPSRLSVDLDFNFVGAENREEMLALRPEVERRLQALARSQGFGVQVSAESHGGRKLYLAYTRLADGQPDRIEVDVNYLHRVCLLPSERRRMWHPDGEGPSATLMSWPEIAAGKLVAFLDRAAPRDAWDVHAPGVPRAAALAAAGSSRSLRRARRPAAETASRIRQAESGSNSRFRRLEAALADAHRRRAAECGFAARRIVVRTGAVARAFSAPRSSSAIACRRESFVRSC